MNGKFVLYMVDKNWTVYIVECSDGTYYCGITNSLEARIEKHNNGTGAKYTRSRGPVTVIAQRDGLTKSEALKLEYKVKKKRKDKKIDFLLVSD
jgi:putative endonuclease